MTGSLQLKNTDSGLQFACSCVLGTPVTVRVTLGLAVYRQSVRLGDKPLETHEQQFFFPNEHVRLQPSCNILSTERMVSVVYNCCWPSPAQSFSGPSLAGLMTTFYCLIFEAPQPGGPGPRIFISQVLSGPVIPQALVYLFVAPYDLQG
jgi:hypothetical protein